MGKSYCVALVLILGIASRVAGENEMTTLILHSEAVVFGPCEAAEDVCEERPATIQIVGAESGGIEIASIYLLARSYDEIRGVQTAFVWPGLEILGLLFDCQSNQLSSNLPNPHTEGGPINGSCSTVFDTVFGGATAVIGRVYVQVSDSACFRQVESAFEGGTHVVGPGNSIAPVPPENRGHVCVGAGGYDACEPAATPVAASTWGAIKAAHR